MILKYVEYKIICDKCAHDIIGWDGFETREDLKEEYKKQYGKLLGKETICDNCKGKEEIFKQPTLRNVGD